MKLAPLVLVMRRGIPRMLSTVQITITQIMVEILPLLNAVRPI